MLRPHTAPPPALTSSAQQTYCTPFEHPAALSRPPWRPHAPKPSSWLMLVAIIGRGGTGHGTSCGWSHGLLPWAAAQSQRHNPGGDGTLRAPSATKYGSMESAESERKSSGRPRSCSSLAGASCPARLHAAPSDSTHTQHVVLRLWRDSHAGVRMTGDDALSLIANCGRSWPEARPKSHAVHQPLPVTAEQNQSKADVRPLTHAGLAARAPVVPPVRTLCMPRMRRGRTSGASARSC